MTVSRRRFLTITGFAAGLAPALLPGMTLARNNMPTSTAGKVARWQGIALGATADIEIIGLPEEQGRTCLALARGEIERLEKQFSLYRPDSALSQLNATGRLDRPGSDMLALLSLASTVNRLSKGRFDPTVQRLWQLYAEYEGKPDAAEVDAAQELTGWQKVQVDETAILMPEGVRMTLNGIAQGYITDRVTRLLRQNGVDRALVEVGEISAIGTPTRKRGWEIHIANEGPMVPLADASMATSAPKGTVFGPGGESHLIDPASGKPASSEWEHTTMIHRSAAIADACSTAACLMRAAEIRKMLEAIGGSVFIGSHRSHGEVRFTSSA